MAKTTTKALAIAKIRSIQNACKRTMRLEDQIKLATDNAVNLATNISTACDRLKDVYNYLQGKPDPNDPAVNTLPVPANPAADIDQLTSQLTDQLAALMELRTKVERWQKVAKDMIDDEEVKKQTWATLEADWPFADAPDNLVDAQGRLVLDQDASNVSSFTGSDINQAVLRIKDIYAYLAGTDGGTVSPITVPGNPNRDIRELTIDDGDDGNGE